MPLTRYLPFMPGSHPVVAVVPLKGAIADLGRGRRGLNLAAVATHLERAFRTKRNKAVALAINSPGGSPVQSALIHRRIRDLAQETEKPVFAFCEDAAASGGYWLAAAGDEIFADACSIVGSIGVVSSGFGFTEAIAKLGVERRVYTAGDKKVILDPFMPEKEGDLVILSEVFSDIHDSFKDLVRDRRGSKLSLDEGELFSGRFWTGKTALAHGLVDGLGHLRPVMRDRFGDKVRFRFYGEKRSSLLGRLLGGGASSEWVEGLASSLEERHLWSRLGL